METKFTEVNVDSVRSVSGRVCEKKTGYNIIMVSVGQNESLKKTNKN